ncbi:ATP-binding protein [Hymenobacter mucosus]|uniref:ATP-binding protein n=1 Tax=Hymenobacter mucosus TaxID=1411120 RepID=UPI00117A64DA|nr:ATP-binding protein [Hymenobacter mucosus]
MKYWLLLLLLLASPVTWGQGTSLQRIQTQLQAHPQQDTGRVNRLNLLAFEQRSSAPRESKATFEEALRLAKRLGYTFGRAKAELGLGFYYRKRNEHGPAQRYTERARQGFAQVHDSLNHLACVYNLAYIYFGQGNYAQALSHAQQGLSLAEKLNNPHWLVLMNAQLGIISTQLGEYVKAEFYLLHCRQLSAQHNNQSGVSQSLRGLGDLYRTQGKWHTARQYYEQDAALASRLGDVPGHLVEEFNIADMYERQGHYPEAFTVGYRALAQLRKLDVIGYLPWTQLVLARAHLHTGRPDSALVYGQASLAASLRSGVKENVRDVSRVLTEASAKLGRYQDAYRYQRLSSIYQDSLSSRELIRRTAALQYGYELSRRQVRIQQLTQHAEQIRQQNRQQQWLLGVALLGLTVVGGLSAVLWRNNQQKQRAYALLEQQQTQLIATQKQLVASEKWAFVGELSAGIAHELQNPLNFMKKFAEVSVGLLSQESASQDASDLQQEIVAGLRQNLQEISQHGQRASAIIADMLAHARTGTSQRQPTDLNGLIQEYLRLAYEGLQAQDASFQATLTTDLHPQVGQVSVVATEIGCVLLNLFTNAFHAVTARMLLEPEGYAPAVSVSSSQEGEHVFIRVRDNGTGMSEEIKNKVFQPFFTTKPVGVGTGLGLSLAHDIITKGHGGTIRVETAEGIFTEFTVGLPR